MVNKFYTILKGVSTEVPQNQNSNKGSRFESHLTNVSQNGNYTNESGISNKTSTNSYLFRK